MNSTLFKKILSFSLVLVFATTPFVSFAQETTPPKARIVVEGNNTYQAASLQGSQANTQNSNTTSGAFTANSGIAAQSFATCSAGGALGNFVKGKISEFVGGVVGGTTRVPTGNAVLEGKDVGVLGFSWDQLGWCLVNSIIESIGAATVQWINGGFQGNPVFIDDPEQFFADIADVQAGAFLGELSNGFLCSPIQSIVRVNLAQSYNSQFSPYGSCTFTAINGNLEQFMSGQSQFSWIDWQSYTQNPQNNPLGASLGGSIQLDQRISSALGIQSTLADWSGGFLSSRDPQTGKITSPGSVIEKQVNERLGSGQRRLEIADEFDEIVNALVNQLIKVAISEMTQQQ